MKSRKLRIEFDKMKKRSADIVVGGTVTVFIIIAMIVFYWAWINGPIFLPLY